MKSLYLILILIVVVASAKQIQKTDEQSLDAPRGGKRPTRTTTTIPTTTSPTSALDDCMPGALCPKGYKCDANSWKCKRTGAGGGGGGGRGGKRPTRTTTTVPTTTSPTSALDDCMPGALCPKGYKCDANSWKCKRTGTGGGGRGGKRPTRTTTTVPTTTSPTSALDDCMPGALCPKGYKCDANSWKCKRTGAGGGGGRGGKRPTRTTTTVPTTTSPTSALDDCMPGALCPKGYKCDANSWKCKRTGTGGGGRGGRGGKRPTRTTTPTTTPTPTPPSNECMPGALCPKGKKCDVNSWTCR